MIPLLGTDNGYIVRQDPVAGWQIVFDDGGSHDPFTDVLYSLLTNPSATQSLWCYHTTFDGTYPALSSPNGGQTWNVGSNQPNPNEFLGIDAAGNLYATVLYGGLQKSTDNGASWFTIYTPPGADQLAFQNVFVANGSVWFINLVGNTLMRCNLDGSGSTAYPAASLADGQDTIMGGGSSNRLLIYAASQSSDLLTVDITNPDNPTFTSVPNPFGATQVPVSVVPITNAVVLALTYDTDPDVQAGQLWRSADGGVTWTSVVGLTKQLQPGGVTGPVLLAADPANSNNVWGATTIPYVYTSTDQGQTWTVETVDLDLGGGFGWTTLTLAGGPWTDDPVTANTPCKAVHVNELRRNINLYQARLGLGPYVWEVNPLSPASPISAGTFTELRTAIQGLWTLQGQGTLPDWSAGGDLTSGRPLAASDMTNLRTWFSANIPPPPTVGANVRPDELGVSAFPISAFQNAGIGAVRLVSVDPSTLPTPPPDYYVDDFIANARGASPPMMVIAIVGIGPTPNYVPTDSTVVLQVGNEPDIYDPPTTEETSISNYADLWVQFRTTYPDRTMIMAGLAGGQPTWYGKFLNYIAAHYPDVDLPAAVDIHPYQKAPSDLAAFFASYTTPSDQTGIPQTAAAIPAMAGEWNCDPAASEDQPQIEPFQQALGIPGMSGVADAFNAYFTWNSANIDYAGNPVPCGIVNRDGLATGAYQQLVVNTLGGELIPPTTATFQVTGSSAQVGIQALAGTTFSLDWGDGSPTTDWTADRTEQTQSHAYSTAGPYTLRLSGYLSQITLLDWSGPNNTLTALPAVAAVGLGGLVDFSALHTLTLVLAAVAALDISGVGTAISLQNLAMSGGSSGSSPDFSLCRSLATVDLSGCGLTGFVPSIGDMTDPLNIDLSNNSLTDYTPGNLASLKTAPVQILFSSNALSQTAVDEILADLVATHLQGGQPSTGRVDLSGGSNNAPSSVGYDSVAVLNGNGWSVTTN